MTVPTSGDTLSGIDLYTFDADVDVGTVFGVDALTLNASNVTATFSTDGLNNPTITIAGTTYVASAVGAAESPSAFTFVSGGNHLSYLQQYGGTNKYR